MRLLAGGLASLISLNSVAACIQVEGMQLPGLESVLKNSGTALNAQTNSAVESLKAVYPRIAEVSRTRPALILCDSKIVNAQAVGTPNSGMVVFYGGLLALLNGNADEIAAVMAHEFAHILLNHSLQKSAAAANLTYWAKQVASQKYQQTGQADEAIKTAITYFQTGVAAFTLEKEREADQKGFSLAVTLAKYSGEGFKSLAKKFSTLPRSNVPPYLEDHPGWLERLENADILTVNQSYLNAAELLFERRDWTQLDLIVKRWLREIPSSPAGWYYNGLSLIRRNSDPEEISLNFEESVALYVDNKVLGALSQEDQTEKNNAWFHLCLALFDEGYKVESARCSMRLKTVDWKEDFQRATFRNVLVAGGAEPPIGALWVARNSDGGRLITNDKPIAVSRGRFYEVPPAWRAIRFPTSREDLRSTLAR